MATDATVGRNQLLYPLDDPQKAWDNALQDQGYNIYRANPFVQSLQRAGRGNRMTYLMDKSLYNGGAQPADQGADYGNYLKDKIGSGNAFYNLDRGYVQMQPAINAIRTNQDNIAAGRTTAAQANPYLQQLSTELAANDGQGTADALTYLRTPNLGTQLGRSYASMLSDIVGSANRSLANDPRAAAPHSGKDIWSYIFGGSQGLF